MPATAQRTFHNHLLRALPGSDFALLQPHLMTVPLRLGEVLIVPHAAIERVHFIEDGILSTIATAADGKQIELALIGREGLVGVPIVMGVPASSYEGRVQASGYAWCIEAAALQAAMRHSASLQALLLRYAYAVAVQIAGTALANARYKLAQRLARWLLMCHDRTEGDELPTTHRFLSLMLGVNRPGLTTAVAAFERAGMIATQRGTIAIVDRPALLAVAGAAYGTPEAEYARLIGGSDLMDKHHDTRELFDK